MAIELTDDGTLDTVLRCTECGEEFRFSSETLADYDPEEMTRDQFIEQCIEDVENEHVCPLDPDAEPSEPGEDDLTTEDDVTFYQYSQPVLRLRTRTAG